MFTGQLQDVSDSPMASFEAHPIDLMEPAHNPWEKFADMLAPVFEWITEPIKRSTASDWGRKRATIMSYPPGKISTRAAVVIYALRPDLLPKDNQVTLAAKHGIGKAAFSKHVRQFRERFKLQTRAMRSEAAREAMRAAMTASHARRKAQAVGSPMILAMQAPVSAMQKQSHR